MKVAAGSANWLLAPLTIAILMAGGPSLVAPDWPYGGTLATISAIPLFAFMFLWFFFRDPDRAVGKHIVSPADGKVVRIDVVDDPDLGRCDRLSIFMRVSDVHVNRMPFDADVRKVTHRPGKHIPAFNKDSDRNEQVQSLLKVYGQDGSVKMERGEAKIIQIAGAVARRIVPYIQPGDHLSKGDRMGLIRLGSRCDLLIPEGQVEWLAEPKMKIRAGVSTVARWR